MPSSTKRRPTARWFAPPLSHAGKAMFVVRRGNDVLPFGTLVSLNDDKTSGIVGDGGSLYLSGLTSRAR